MSRLHEGLEYRDFQQPEGLTTSTVCRKSGKLAVAGLCDADPRGNMVTSEYFTVGTVPTEYCDHHVSATICADSGMLANEFCPETSRQTNIYITGGSPDSEDGPYLLTDELAQSICPIHTAESIMPEVPEVPELPDTLPGIENVIDQGSTDRIDQDMTPEDEDDNKLPIPNPIIPPEEEPEENDKEPEGEDVPEEHPQEEE